MIADGANFTLFFSMDNQVLERPSFPTDLQCQLHYTSDFHVSIWVCSFKQHLKKRNIVLKSETSLLQLSFIESLVWARNYAQSFLWLFKLALK